MTEVPAGNIYKDRSTTTRGQKVGGWVAEFRWPQRGIRKRWRGRTKVEALAQMEAYKDTLRQGLKPEDATFNLLADAYLADLKRSARPTTVAFAMWALNKARPHIGHMLVADIVKSDIEGVLNAIEDTGLSPRSVQAIRGQVRAVMQRAVEDRLVLSNPVDLVRRTKTKSNGKRLTLPPVEDVLAVLDGMQVAGHPSWPMLHVIAASGLRTGEARGLRWQDVDRAAGVVHVRGQMDRQGDWVVTKTDAGERTIPLTPRIVAALDEMASRQAAGSVRSLYAFADGDGQVPAPWTAHRAWTRAQDKAWGKVRLTVHGLRHLALSVLVSQGVSLPDVAAHAGHADSRILSEVYAHALHDREARIAKALKDAGVG